MAKAPKKEKPVIVDPVPTHAVVYCDGGYVASGDGIYNYANGLGGWGVHGYTFDLAEPKKGTGNPKVIPTTNGYRFDDGDKICIDGPKVTAVEYVDMCGGSKAFASNNDTELYAFIMTMNWALEQPHLTSLRVYSDSKYVVLGSTTYIDKWIKNNWLLSTGDPVKNKERWQEVKRLYTLCKEKFEFFKIEWTRGHNGNPGNEKADQLATLGISQATREGGGEHTEYHMSNGYWSVKSEVPRILQAPRMYFSSKEEEDINEKDGKTIYYLGTHGTKDKEDDLPGKRYSDNFLGVVFTSTPDPVLTLCRKHLVNEVVKKVKRKGALIIGMLDAIFSPKTYKHLKNTQAKFLLTNSRRIDVYSGNKQPLFIELHPVGLGFNLQQTWLRLKERANEIVDKNPFYEYTDITDTLYEEPDSKGKRKLKAEFTNIKKFVDIPTQFNLEPEFSEKKPFSQKVRCIFGSDILSRNQLAALADEIESVQLVTWRESDKVGRYGTFVKLTNGDYGIWCRYDANLMFKKG